MFSEYLRTWKSRCNPVSIASPLIRLFAYLYRTDRYHIALLVNARHKVLHVISASPLHISTLSTPITWLTIR